MLGVEELRLFLAGLAGLDPGVVSDETLFFSSGLLDSFDLVRVLAFVENKIGKRIKPIDINTHNFDSIVKILEFAESSS
jgi:acyl carrier protein